MGLSIFAYSNIKRVEDPEIDIEDAFESDDMVPVIIGDSLPQADDLEEGDVYHYDSSINVFHAPYHEYHELLNELARIAGYEPAGDTGDEYPYSESVMKKMMNEGAYKTLLCWLISFPDNEGEMGSATCRQIAQDLKTLLPKANELSDKHQKYLNQLIETFEFASNKGMVQYG